MKPHAVPPMQHIHNADTALAVKTYKQTQTKPNQNSKEEKQWSHAAPPIVPGWGRGGPGQHCAQDLAGQRAELTFDHSGTDYGLVKLEGRQTSYTCLVDKFEF